MNNKLCPTPQALPSSPEPFPKALPSPKPFPKPFPEKAWRKQAGLGKALPSQSQVLDKGVVLLAWGRREGKGRRQGREEEEEEETE